jgi:hypothetical protein
MERVVVTVDEHANTSSASIPLALDRAVSDGRVKRGELLLFEAFGAGFTWGSALVRYSVDSAQVTSPTTALCPKSPATALRPLSVFPKRTAVHALYQGIYDTTWTT